MSSIRQRLNLEAPTGEKLFLTQLSTGAALTAEGTMTMTLPTLKLISTDGTVNNVAVSILANAAAIAAETTARQADVASIQASITSGGEQYTTALTNEATTRSGADSTLQSNITAEAAARELADNALQGLLDAEISNRTSADTNLQNNITAEESARITAVTGEASARIAADDNLQNNIEQVNNQRAADFAMLSGEINTERTRIDSILSLSTAELDSFKEIADAYQNADSNLLNLITQLTTNFNALKAVVDVLATNTESGA